MVDNDLDLSKQDFDIPEIRSRTLRKIEKIKK